MAEPLATEDIYGVVDFAVGPLTFSAWLDHVDVEVVRITSVGDGVGLSHQDFNDWSYAAAFEDGLEPVQAARDMLAEDVIGAQFLDLAGVEGGW